MGEYASYLGERIKIGTCENMYYLRADQRHLVSGYDFGPKVLEVIRRNTIGLVEDYFVLINVREDNRRLSGELGKLKMENHFLRSELETAERARALIAFQARTPSRTVPARWAEISWLTSSATAPSASIPASAILTPTAGDPRASIFRAT